MDKKTSIFLEKADFLRIIPSKFLRMNLRIGPVGEIHRVCDSFSEVIKKIIEKREKTGLSGEESADDALSLLLKERRNNRENSTGGGILTDEELISNAFVLLVAGK